MSKSRLVLLATVAFLLLAVPLLGACKTSTQTTTKAATTTQQTTTRPPTTAAATTTAAVTTTAATTTTTAAPKPTTTTLKPLPSIVGLTTASGTGTGTTATAVADALGKQLGIKISMQAVGNKVENMQLLKTGQVQMYASSTTTTLDPLNGKGDFAKAPWGPQPLRTLVVGKSRFWGFYTTKKTGIKTFADVKGKRVTFFPSDLTRTNTMESAFKAHGFTWNDVKKVSFDETGAAQQGLLDGTVDVAFTGFPAPKMVEVDATLGAVVIGFSNTPEMIKIFQSLLPHELVIAAKGSFVGVVEDMLLPASVDAFIAYNTLDDDLAYQITKGVYDANAEILKNPAAEGWLKANAASIPTPAPYHPGAIRFYKEVGLWTPAHDKWQAEALQREKDTIANFKFS